MIALSNPAQTTMYKNNKPTCSSNKKNKSIRSFNNNLHQRDSRNALFGSYEARAQSKSPAGGSRPSSGYGYQTNGHAGGPSGNGGAFSAYPGSSGPGFRSATPNAKGQYSDAVLDELESQNDDQVAGMSEGVKMLKDITVAIGDEIRDSSKLADRMNDSFDNTRVRLRGTMNRMLRMAERTGVGWRVWLVFFAAVMLLFWYVWLF